MLCQSDLILLHKWGLDDSQSHTTVCIAIFCSKCNGKTNTIALVPQMSFVCLSQLLVCFVFVDTFFPRKLGILMGFSLTSRVGIDGNAPYQAKELQITVRYNEI